RVSTTSPICSGLRATSRALGRCTSGRLRSTKPRTAPSIQRSLRTSTTSPHCFALKVTLPPRGRSPSGRWRSKRRRSAPSIARPRRASTTSRSCFRLRATSRALAIYEKALGPEHPWTATSLDNLALLLRAQGDLAGARPLHERALAIFEKALGPGHPSTKNSARGLALTLDALGRGDEAAGGGGRWGLAGGARLWPAPAPPPFGGGGLGGGVAPGL